MDISRIRNFCIIAHIDHGKSTLADRFLQITKTVDKRHFRDQLLDSMELEREKGVTIKLSAVRMMYELGGQEYQLNLIDTPGHVDFSYEVSRSLAACEGAVLVVDASQGIQAQTVSNVYKALEAGLKIVPVINKIDLPGVDIDGVSKDLASTFGFDEKKILKVSAKTGEGVENLLAEIVNRVPSPRSGGGKPDQTRALVFDTFYDDYLGVIALVKVVGGAFSKDLVISREKIKFLATKVESVPEEIGILNPERVPVDKLSAGEVGYIATGLKNIQAARVGDTVTLSGQDVDSLPGYQEIKPFVFVSFYLVKNKDFSALRSALEKLSLSDAALSFEPESSGALGFGFRCGFLGLFHADIVQERLEREYNLELISTTPHVVYEVELSDGGRETIKTPAEFPDPAKIKRINEPWILASVVTPSEYLGLVIDLCQRRRGVQKRLEYPTPKRVLLEYELPLVELIFNFFDDLKSVSSGFASLDYEILGYREAKVVKMDVLVHGEPVEPLSQIVLREDAEEAGRRLLKKLKAIIPRQQFQVTLQAAIGGKIIAREDIPAMRKTVLHGISGGHRERKDKLLERQKKGKERLKKIGKVSIPQEAFRQVLSH